MKQIRLQATDSIPEMGMDLVGGYGYEKDQNGADLLCGHCDAVIFPAHSLDDKGMRLQMQGVTCPSCGGSNTFDTQALKGE
ncbi:hypothetical protein FHW00_003771 [Ochrobactrum sp. P6BSIII]|uniref:hypothetical protein n=1 Tax=unclassified Ochrobactrum TaxID=239106 RepID=UPI001115E256|nr:hypothetical protein [Ochrobactrum sp. P6BSIII]